MAEHLATIPAAESAIGLDLLLDKATGLLKGRKCGCAGAVHARQRMSAQPEWGVREQQLQSPVSSPSALFARSSSMTNSIPSSTKRSVSAAAARRASWAHGTRSSESDCEHHE